MATSQEGRFKRWGNRFILLTILFTLTMLTAGCPDDDDGGTLPVATDDTATTTAGTPVTIPVLNNDSNGTRLFILQVTQGANGAATIANERRTIIYTPFPNTVGVDTFTYTLGDGQNTGTDTATVTVTVNLGNNVQVSGLVDDGTPTSPIPDAECRFVNLEGMVLNMTTADGSGSYTFIMPPELQGFIECNPPGSPNLVLRAFFSTVGVAAGTVITDQDVRPDTTLISRLLDEARTADPTVNLAMLAADLSDDLDAEAPDIAVLADAATILFNDLMEGGIEDVSFADALTDLLTDGTLDNPAFASIAADVNMAVQEAEETRGVTVGNAFSQFAGFTLTVLHNNDGESQLINAGSGLEDFGGVARFATVVEQLRIEGQSRGLAILVSSGDNLLAGPEFNASLSREGEDRLPFFDTIALDLIDYEAFAIGNHEFDFGPDVLEEFITGFTDPAAPFLSANLDFSDEPGLQTLVDAGRIAPSTVVTMNGRQIGIIGATTPLLASISSPRNVMVDTDVADAIQTEIDRLTADGVTIIILISHLQSLIEDRELIPQLSDLDIAIAGGGDELLANEGTVLIPGDTPSDPYPIFEQDADGNDIPVVTTSGSYRYVGRLVVHFDVEGNVVSIDPTSGPRRVAGAMTTEDFNAIAVNASDDITRAGIGTFSGGIARTLRIGAFYASPPRGYQVGGEIVGSEEVLGEQAGPEGPVQAVLDTPVSKVSFSFRHGQGTNADGLEFTVPEGTATAFAANGTELGTVNSTDIADNGGLVELSGFATAIARIDFSGGGIIDDFSVANADGVMPDPDVQAQVVDPVQASVAALADNIIGTSEVPLNGLRSDVRTLETNEGNLIADAHLFQARQLAEAFGAPEPDIALVNGGGIRNDTIIPAGNLSELDTFDILPFTNFVSLVPNISAMQFRELLENAVSRVDEIDGRFAQIAGFRFEWDATEPARTLDDEGSVVTEGSRIRNVMLDDGTMIVADGTIVDGAPALNIATIDFLARGGDQYPFGDVDFFSLGVTYQQALLNYIQDEAGLNGIVTAEQYPEGGEGRITRLP